MKRFLSILMAAAMVFALATSALAVDSSGDAAETLDDTTTIAVSGSATLGESGGTVYYVEISWTATDLVYTEAGTYEWNPETLAYEYTSADTDGTTNGSVTITVANSSNAAVMASISYEDAGTGAESSLDIDGSSAELETAAQSGGEEIAYTDTSSTGTTVEETFTGSVSVDNVSALTSEGATLGTITLTITSSTLATYTYTSSSTDDTTTE